MIGKLKNVFIALYMCMLTIGCNEKPKEMQYAKIYFPLAARANTDGLFPVTFNYLRDTTFVVAVYCSGSIFPSEDLHVTVGLAEDSLAAACVDYPQLQTYEILPTASYSIQPDLTTTIKSGTNRGDFSITLYAAELDVTKKYILPLYIQSVTQYEAAEKYHYLFLGIEQ
jgi:hypothetical protein